MPIICDVLGYFSDVKTTVWALTETLPVASNEIDTDSHKTILN